jgi:hypothetical protein
MTLDKLTQTVEAMTKGPWYQQPGNKRYVVTDALDCKGDLIVTCAQTMPYNPPEANGAGIAILRNVAEELIAVARAARPFALAAETDIEDCTRRPRRQIEGAAAVKSLWGEVLVPMLMTVAIGIPLVFLLFFAITYFCS